MDPTINSVLDKELETPLYKATSSAIFQSIKPQGILSKYKHKFVADTTACKIVPSAKALRSGHSVRAVIDPNPTTSFATKQPTAMNRPQRAVVQPGTPRTARKRVRSEPESDHDGSSQASTVSGSEEKTREQFNACCRQILETSANDGLSPDTQDALSHLMETSNHAHSKIMLPYVRDNIIKDREARMILFGASLEKERMRDLTLTSLAKGIEEVKGLCVSLMDKVVQHDGVLQTLVAGKGQSNVHGQEMAYERHMQAIEASIPRHSGTEVPAATTAWDSLDQKRKEQVKEKCGSKLPRFKVLLEETRSLKKAFELLTIETNASPSQ